MFHSIRLLLEKIVDYAGLFPPAGLPLDEASANYVRYRSEADAWMLSRFICPTSRLSDFASTLGTIAAPVPVSALLGTDDDSARFVEIVARDLTNATANEGERASRIRVESVEVKLPRLSSSTNYLEPLVDRIVNTTPRLTAWLEPRLDNDWRNAFPALCDALKAVEPKQARQPVVGLKLRCGGPDKESIPAVQQVASVIATCRDYDLPLKFTAGLHHPFRHTNAESNVASHGFINVFAAGILARAQRLKREEIADIVADEDCNHFACDDSGLRWKNFEADVSQIESGRAWVRSFGSCSFDEPREDLRALNWIE